MIATPAAAKVLFGKAQRAVLSLLFGHPDQAFYLSEILSYAQTGASQIQKELQQLTAAGLLIKEKRGKQVYFRANPNAPIFEELKAIVTKTFGVAGVVRTLLQSLSSRIDLAFIFGSVARGEETAASDVDLFIVGEIGVSDIAESLVTAEAELRRSISPTIYGRGEFVQKARTGHHFIGRILAEPKVFLIGTQRTLDDLLQRQSAQS